MGISLDQPLFIVRQSRITFDTRAKIALNSTWRAGDEDGATFPSL